MNDVNLGGVVEVLDLLVSPSVYQLRLSVYFVVLPSSIFEVNLRLVFVAPSCIHGFMMILLPWVVTTFLSF